MSMIAGLRGESKKDVYPVVHKLTQEFGAAHGSVLCRDLKGNCLKLIDDAVAQLHRHLAENHDGCAR